MENKEDWEKEMRLELENKLEEGFYSITTPRGILGTGKSGFIDFEIAMHKQIRETLTIPNLTKFIIDCDKRGDGENHPYKKLTYEILGEEMSRLRKLKDGT